MVHVGGGLVAHDAAWVGCEVAGSGGAPSLVVAALVGVGSALVVGLALGQAVGFASALAWWRWSCASVDVAGAGCSRHGHPRQPQKACPLWDTPRTQAFVSTSVAVLQVAQALEQGRALETVIVGEPLTGSVVAHHATSVVGRVAAMDSTENAPVVRAVHLPVRWCRMSSSLVGRALAGSALRL